MADFTKNAIQDSFIKLLNEKPLKQITVRDIVEDCGINRNTFYYHFKDMPDLIESILIEDTKNLVLDNKDLATVEDCLNVVIEFCLNHRKEVLHIYKSVNRDFFEQYHWRLCTYVVTEYIDRQLDDIHISDEDRAIIISYVKCLLFGIVMGWLENNLDADIQKFMHRICELKQSDLDVMIQKCRIS